MHPHRRRNPSLAGRAGEAFLFGALVAAGIDAAALPAAAQSVELAWKLQAGTELVYRTEGTKRDRAAAGYGDVDDDRGHDPALERPGGRRGPQRDGPPDHRSDTHEQ